MKNFIDSANKTDLYEKYYKIAQKSNFSIDEEIASANKILDFINDVTAYTKALYTQILDNRLQYYANRYDLKISFNDQLQLNIVAHQSNKNDDIDHNRFISAEHFDIIYSIITDLMKNYLDFITPKGIQLYQDDGYVFEYIEDERDFLVGKSWKRQR